MKKFFYMVCFFMFLYLNPLTTCQLSVHRFCCQRKVIDLRVVRVCSSSGGGTGFWISKDQVLTCWHVVNDDGPFEVIDYCENYYEAVLVKHDFVTDLALLHVKEGNSKKLFQISKDNAQAFTKVSYIGHPFPYSWLKMDGKVILPETFLPTSDSVLFIPHSKGASGSPVFNSSGEVIGILKGALQPQPVFITNSRAIRAFLNSE